METADGSPKRLDNAAQPKLPACLPGQLNLHAPKQGGGGGGGAWRAGAERCVWRGGMGRGVSEERERSGRAQAARELPVGEGSGFLMAL